MNARASSPTQKRARPCSNDSARSNDSCAPTKRARCWKSSKQKAESRRQKAEGSEDRLLLLPTAYRLLLSAFHATGTSCGADLRSAFLTVKTVVWSVLPLTSTPPSGLIS